QQPLLAGAADGDGLELRRCDDASQSHRRGLPVRSKKTSARDWACMSISVISRPASARAEHAAAIWAELGAFSITIWVPCTEVGAMSFIRESSCAEAGRSSLIDSE